MAKTNFDFLSDIDFLQKVSVDTLECLASECQLKELAVGEVLFQDGEEGDSMYVILSGVLVESMTYMESPSCHTFRRVGCLQK